MFSFFVPLRKHIHFSQNKLYLIAHYHIITLLSYNSLSLTACLSVSANKYIKFQQCHHYHHHHIHIHHHHPPKQNNNLYNNKSFIPVDVAFYFTQSPPFFFSPSHHHVGCLYFVVICEQRGIFGVAGFASGDYGKPSSQLAQTKLSLSENNSLSLYICNNSEIITVLLD